MLLFFYIFDPDAVVVKHGGFSDILVVYACYFVRTQKLCMLY